MHTKQISIGYINYETCLQNFGHRTRLRWVIGESSEIMPIEDFYFLREVYRRYCICKLIMYIYIWLYVYCKMMYCVSTHSLPEHK
jgi:hypothetical protein